MEKQILESDVSPGGDVAAVEAAPRLNDASAEDLARQRYAEVICGLVNEAIKAGKPSVLVNVLTINLAWLIVEHGPNAAGHVLERLGTHISYFADRNRAVKEAEVAREEGRLVN